MRIRVLSDLHLGLGEGYRPALAPADAVVVAGDVGMGLRLVDWTAGAFAGPRIVVPGNHDFDGTVVDAHRRALARRAAERDVTLLDDGEATVCGVRFLGCTLWTDFLLFGDVPAVADTVRAAYPDFRTLLRADGRRSTPADLAERHAASLAWLSAALGRGGGESTVVVTHFAPSARSLRPDRAASPLSAAFAAALDGLVEASGAALWVHGHTHHAVDYRIGGTRVISNPRGYPGESTGWDEGLVVEI
jgi:predicted phosphodiesterase